MDWSMRRLLPEGLTEAGQRLAESLYKRQVRFPISEGALAATLEGIDDPTLRGMRLRLEEGGRMSVAGEKRKGVWIPFTVTFIAVPPPAHEVGQAVDLYLERVEPLLAHPFILRALDRLEEMEVRGNRARVRIDRWVGQQEWARLIPEALRSRVRVVDVTTDAERRLLVTLGWDEGGGHPASRP